MKGVFCKNLFLKDRKGVFYLVICVEDCQQVDLKWLKHRLHAARNFSFATADELVCRLDVDQGCVSPFALINDAQRSTQIVIDVNLQLCNDLLNFHPLDPEQTSLISFDNLMRFLCYCGYQPVITSMQAVASGY
jgi:Ala-tRNA(Pro) deacylase